MCSGGSEEGGGGSANQKRASSSFFPSAGPGDVECNRLFIGSKMAAQAGPVAASNSQSPRRAMMPRAIRTYPLFWQLLFIYLYTHLVACLRALYVTQGSNSQFRFIFTPRQPLHRRTIREIKGRVMRVQRQTAKGRAAAK